ncbi:hypothetical protein [Herbiconiux sp.]|uniref:hypothetical protein n=1 Tax=Herbiconiux sp. TaxID=1871186 RepID=UPI0025C458F2|nr:hypothetical protein [Herbiconiux sp.]
MERREGSRDLRFTGRIAGFGTASGTRIVIGMWHDSPFGRFADVMVEDAGGHRLLLAPSREIADFVAATYTFDEVLVRPVRVRRIAGGLAVEVGDSALVDASDARSWRLSVRIRVGAVSPLGRVLRSIPARLGTWPAWLRVIDPLAGLLLPGVRTAGSAGGGRREFYGVTRVRRIAWASARLDGIDLGGFAPLRPSVRFGFGSAPPEPSLVDLVTTIRDPSL